LVAACDSDGAEVTVVTSGTTATSTTTTTTIDVAGLCVQLAEDAAAFFEEAVEELDDITYEEFSERSRWPDDLVELQALGEELDSRAGELGCDAGTIQEYVFAEAADLVAEGAVSQLLLELLVPGAG
jgi:hypothetical protein